MAANGRKTEKRRCPRCKEVKAFDVRNEFCSRDCGAKSLATVAPSAEDSDPIVEGVKRALKADACTKESLAKKLGTTTALVAKAMEALAKKGYQLASRGKHGWRIVIDVDPTQQSKLIVHPSGNFNNKWYTFGVFGDNHSGSKHERVDVVNALYDRFEEAGVKDVFHTGNMLEGEMRLNKHDIKVFGLDAQVQHFIDGLPEKKGMKTHFVTGDDHEGWYQRNEGIEIGRHIEQTAHAGGRKDLDYLGYVEADVILQVPGGERLMRVMHPGGGAAYALSYSAQKIVESFQGGEKPSILLYGHYHKFDLNYYREVYNLGTGCCVDQSIFMRKQKIQAHVGGLIIRIHQAPDGAINRFQVEWMPFYDRSYYQRKREFGVIPSPKNLVFGAEDK